MPIQNSYYRGVVETYDEKAGYGYIRPDEERNNELILVHSRSLREGLSNITVGERVLFKKESIPRGTLARDVHPEMTLSDELEDLAETVTGRVVSYDPVRAFGFIQIHGRPDAFFHVTYIVDPLIVPAIDDVVTCKPVLGEKGFEARDVVIRRNLHGVPDRKTNDLLAQAVLAREERNYEKADGLYRRGLKENPSEHLISSYAAFKKNRQQRNDALRIYELGIQLFPGSAKAHEEAGILAASLQMYQKAIGYFERALQLVGSDERGPSKSILASLGLTYYKIGTPDAYRNAIKYYERAIHAYGNLFVIQSRHGGPLHHHVLAFNLAKIRLHYRGRIAYNFFNNGIFEILHAEYIDTGAADLIVRTKNVELIESYGLTGHLLVRCMFKKEVNVADLEQLDQRVANLQEGMADDQVVLLVTGMLSQSVQRFLFTRVEDRNQMRAAIIPIQQEDIERSTEPVSALVSVFDKWLFRRDLYALNSPVKGRRFFGRGKALSELRDAIHTSTPIGVFGLRKVGKTSLLQEAQHRASESGDIVIYLDLLRVPGEITDARWLFWRLANLLCEATGKMPFASFTWRLGSIQDYFDIPPELPVATAFDSDLTRLLTAIKTSNLKPRPTVVILLDEVESLLPTKLGRGFRGFFDFFSYFRGVCQETKDLTLVITAANASIAEIAQFEGRDNPVFNFFREVYLQFLEPAECAEMVRTLGRSMGITYQSEHVLSHLFSLTGGHPFFTRQLCSFIAKQYATRPLTVTIAMIDSVVERYIDLVGEKDFNEIFERLSRDYPVERDACLALAQAGGTLSINVLAEKTRSLRVSLRHLEGYQIVRIRDQTVSLSMELLKRWLKRGYVQT